MLTAGSLSDLRHGDSIDLTLPLLAMINATILPSNKIFNGDPFEEDMLLWCLDPAERNRAKQDREKAETRHMSTNQMIQKCQSTNHTGFIDHGRQHLIRHYINDKVKFLLLINGKK
ncbi:hypothetical protein FRX31_007724 [Thalictrum thalictroides]|uniref:Uncharacterized protein n=1 Tax=Thalictrum thalictroides TaxID=46969 RepID=A0A7J6X0V8_THATH|nr:hypothetical protein FRX31_007724 [Thalictrum thalictroides]